MNAQEIYETLKRHVRDELYRVHTGGHGDGCPQCIREGATWKGCPVIDEYMVERIINVCNSGIQGMTIAAQREQANQTFGSTNYYLTPESGSIPIVRLDGGKRR